MPWPMRCPCRVASTWTPRASWEGDGRPLGAAELLLRVTDPLKAQVCGMDLPFRSIVPERRFCAEDGRGGCRDGLAPSLVSAVLLLCSCRGQKR